MNHSDHQSMDSETITDETNSSTSKGTSAVKLRTKERHRTDATIVANTDINDPENLDYEEEETNKTDENHSNKLINDQLVNLNHETKVSSLGQNEEGEMPTNPEDLNHRSSPIDNNKDETVSDEGELDEVDLEDGEIHDPSASKSKPISTDASTTDQQRNRSIPPSSPQGKVHCRFFLQGRCHWGPNCKYIHPTNETQKNSNNLTVESVSTIKNDVSPPSSAGISIPSTPNSVWMPAQAPAVTSHFFSNPMIRGPAPALVPGIPIVAASGAESAWERGLRSAKTLREQSMRRKQQDKDFNEKKFNLTLRDALDEKDADEHLLNIDRPPSDDYAQHDPAGPTYSETRNYPDRYHPYPYPNSSAHSQYNNPHRTNNTNRHASTSSNKDNRARHNDDYVDDHRKEKSSMKNNKTSSRRDETSSYKRNSSQQQYTSGAHHDHDAPSHLKPYHNRRGDDWHDPWDRSRKHSSGHRRPSGGPGRGPNDSSSSRSSSSSSRSSRSRSQSTSSSSRSRSRSRSRPKRRSPSVTRAMKPVSNNKSSETVKNGNEKKSNGNKKSEVSLSPTANKFLPGRQISSHTLKKAEKSSNSHSSGNHRSKNPRGKDSDLNLKRSTRKENPSSSSSSSSSDSDSNGPHHRSSSSSSDSSSSENETRKIKTGKASTSGGGSSSHATKSIHHQVSSSSGGAASKNSNSKSKTDSSTRAESNSKETTTKKRRDTSSSTGSTNAIKKSKTQVDSQKSSSTDPSNAENSDSNKKKEKQKLRKQVHEAEKLLSQRSTKTSS